jgi:type I restriction enzyme M protein
MTRQEITKIIGDQYHTANIEEDEYSYAKEAGTLAKLENAVGHKVSHYKLDRRFEDSNDTGNFVVLVETKQNFVDSDAEQLAAYLEEERALHKGRKVICILANTTANDDIRVWKSEIDDDHLLKDETVLESMEHYEKLFAADRQNDREKVMKNTYDLNELLHKKDIDEKKRSQFVGTCLLFVKSEISKIGGSGYIDKAMIDKLDTRWSSLSENVIRAGVQDVLNGLLDGTNNKAKKIELLQRNVLNDQKVKKLTLEDWIQILNAITTGIYKYIDADSSEGQDILNLFFITFNKYTGKADKNQAFTPDHITDFMTRLTEVNRNSRVLDECCGSGSFLVQAMVKELADCRKGRTEADAKKLMNEVKEQHIFGIEVEENAYGLATTNMLIHGDGNSNIEFGSCFEKEKFIKNANPDIVLMNPPYNAKPRTIPDNYKRTWTAKEKDGKEDPTKGFVFVQYLSDVFKRMDKTGVKLAVLLPMSAAIGTSKRITEAKKNILKDNTLEAVFSLPAEVFYPGASVQACCMLFTMGIPHDSKNHETFFGYYKEDGFKKKKNLGRVEQFDNNGHSIWKKIENQWLNLFRNKKVVAGLSAMKSVSGDDEWLCEAYMETDFSTIIKADFENVLNDYLSFLISSGEWKWLDGFLKLRSDESDKDLTLDISKWKEFKFGTLIEKKNIYKAKAHTKEEVEKCSPTFPGAIPFVSRTEPNNSVDMFVVNNDLEGIESGNALIVGDTTATVSYQANDFVAGDHIVVIRAKWLNLYTGLFIVALLRKEKYRYSYGRAFVMDSIKDTIIKIPVDADGNPDWEWMQKFIKSLPCNFIYK